MSFDVFKYDGRFEPGRYIEQTAYPDLPIPLERIYVHKWIGADDPQLWNAVRLRRGKPNKTHGAIFVPHVGGQTGTGSPWAEVEPIFDAVADSPHAGGLVGGILNGDGRLAIVGASKAGKTTVALTLAIAIASGRKSIFGKSINRQCPVLYVATEQGRAELAALASRIGAGLGVNVRELVRGKWLLLLSTLEPPNGFPSDLSTDDARNVLAGTAAHYDCGVTVIDTISEGVFDGNVSQGYTVKDALSDISRRLRAVGSDLVAVHHVVKSAEGARTLTTRAGKGDGLRQWQKTGLAIGARRRRKGVEGDVAEATLESNSGPTERFALAFSYEDGATRVRRLKGSTSSEPRLPAAARETASPASEDANTPAAEVREVPANAPPRTSDVWQYVVEHAADRPSARVIEKAIGARHDVVEAAMNWLVGHKFAKRLRRLDGERQGLRIAPK